uniref:Uncharacterized protein n=1 Tax=Romanomermis culicivorax TaxID=13658 RepID=A0A915IWM8_ROMCU
TSSVGAHSISTAAAGLHFEGVFSHLTRFWWLDWKCGRQNGKLRLAGVDVLALGLFLFLFSFCQNIFLANILS